MLNVWVVNARPSTPRRGVTSFSLFFGGCIIDMCPCLMEGVYAIGRLFFFFCVCGCISEITCCTILASLIGRLNPQKSTKNKKGEGKRRERKRTTIGTCVHSVPQARSPRVTEMGAVPVFTYMSRVSAVIQICEGIKQKIPEMALTWTLA